VAEGTASARQPPAAQDRQAEGSGSARRPPKAQGRQTAGTASARRSPKPGKSPGKSPAKGSGKGQAKGSRSPYRPVPKPKEPVAGPPQKARPRAPSTARALPRSMAAGGVRVSPAVDTRPRRARPGEEGGLTGEIPVEPKGLTLFPTQPTLLTSGALACSGRRPRQRPQTPGAWRASHGPSTRRPRRRLRRPGDARPSRSHRPSGPCVASPGPSRPSRTRSSGPRTRG